MIEKRDLLAVRCREILEAHGMPGRAQSLTVSQYFKQETLPETSRQAQINTMAGGVEGGVYYLEVLETGPTERLARDEQMRWLAARHRFMVTLYLQYEDAPEYQNTSQFQFETLVEGTGEPCGLLTALRQTGLDGAFKLRAQSGAWLKVNGPIDDRKDIVPLNMEGTEAAHLLTFLIDIEDVL